MAGQKSPRFGSGARTARTARTARSGQETARTARAVGGRTVPPRPGNSPSSAPPGPSASEVAPLVAAPTSTTSTTSTNGQFKKLTHDAVWNFFCHLDADVDHLVTESDVVGFVTRLAHSLPIRSKEAQALFQTALAAKVDTKISKTALSFRDFQKMFLVRRKLSGQSHATPGHWTLVADYPDHHRWVVLLKAAVKQYPYEAEYQEHQYQIPHSRPAAVSHFEKEAAQRQAMRATQRKLVAKKTQLLTPRNVSNQPVFTKNKTDEEVEAAGHHDSLLEETYTFHDDLKHVQDNPIHRSHFVLQDEFNTAMRDETAARGSNMRQRDYYAESFKDTHDVSAFGPDGGDSKEHPYLSHADQLAAYRDKKAWSGLVLQGQQERGLARQQEGNTRPCAERTLDHRHRHTHESGINGRKAFTTLTAPMNNTEASNAIAIHNNPIREPWKEIDTRTTRQMKWDEEKDPYKLAFSKSGNEIARLSHIQNDKREEYKWKRCPGPSNNLYKTQDLKHAEKFAISERVMNYHNQLYPATDVNPTVGNRRYARPPATDRSHYRPRRVKVNSAPLTSRNGITLDDRQTQVSGVHASTRPFGFKAKEMPIQRELGNGTLHVSQTVREELVRNVACEARVSTKLRAMTKPEVPWIETKMGILRVPEKRKELGDIDHHLVDTQHPLRRGK